MDEGLKEAVEQIEKAVQNEEALRAYYNIEIKKMEIENQMQEANEKGIEKGIEKEKIQTARKLKDMGISIEDIAKVTDLSQEFIKNL